MQVSEGPSARTRLARGPRPGSPCTGQLDYSLIPLAGSAGDDGDASADDDCSTDDSHADLASPKVEKATRLETWGFQSEEFLEELFCRIGEGE